MPREFNYSKFAPLDKNTLGWHSRPGGAAGGFSNAVPLTSSDTNGSASTSTIEPLPKPDAFRILLIHPGEHQDQLNCTLLVRHLNQVGDSPCLPPEKYDALSYNWGPQRPHKLIKIISGDVPYSFPIGPNLEAALRQFRQPDRDVYLWVDALCINQADNEEKSSQIPLMRQIYSRAECVRIWLGREADGSAKAMDFVRDCLDLNEFDRLIAEPVASPKWAALASLMRRPWFSRRWVIQEIAMAKNAEVHCGTQSIPWHDFAYVVSMLSRKQDKLRQLFRESQSYGNHPDYLGDLRELGAIRLADYADNLFRKLDDGNIAEKLFSLEGLMSSLTAFEASNPHDILYAILWLAKDAHPVTKNASRRTFSLPPHEITDISFSSPYQRSPIALTFEAASPRLLETNSTEPFPEIPDPSLNANALHPADAVNRKRTISDLANVVAFTSSAHEALPSAVTHPESIRSHPDSTASIIRQGMLSPIRTSSSVTPSASRRPSFSSDMSRIPSNPSSTSNFYALHSSHSRPRLNSLSGDVKSRAASAMFMEGIKSGRIVVDYEKEVWEVCRDFLGFTFRQSNSLDMICKPWAPRVSGLPTWVSQLNGTAFAPTSTGIYRRINADSLVDRIGHPDTGQRPYRASGGHPAEWQFGGPDGKSLIVKGFVFDKIQERKTVASDGVIPSDWMHVGGWEDHSRPPPDLFWRTLVGNMDGKGGSPPGFWQLSCRDAFGQRPNGGALNIRDVLLDCSSSVAEFLERVQTVVWSRRLALLDRNSKQAIAIVPAKAKKGDLICILHGCSVPVALRQIIDGERATKRRKCPNQDCRYSKDNTIVSENSRIHFEVVGECYVHSMMNGDAFSVRRNHRDEKSFELR